MDLATRMRQCCPETHSPYSSAARNSACIIRTNLTRGDVRTRLILYSQNVLDDRGEGQRLRSTRRCVLMSTRAARENCKSAGVLLGCVSGRRRFASFDDSSTTRWFPFGSPTMLLEPCCRVLLNALGCFRLHGQRAVGSQHGQHLHGGALQWSGHCRIDRLKRSHVHPLQ